MGMSSWQVLTRVEVPLALPLVFAGIRTSGIYVVSTATIAAIAGGGGLGDIIVNQASYRLSGVVGASMCVVALSLAISSSLGAVQRLVTPRGVRGRVVMLEPRAGSGRT